jgi:ADP-heptose:LPS heptosyltransferase
VKPRLLIIELWGLGDLVIATPFLRAAAERFEVTVLAKPFARDLQARFWPDVKVVPFQAPWTAFEYKNKYRLWSWPWRDIFSLRKILRRQFNVGLSARSGDPRDHFLLACSGSKKRLGFPRMGSQIFLTQSLQRPDPAAHRYEYWRVLGKALGLELPLRSEAFPLRAGRNRQVFIHSGAGQPVRVWPLERYRGLIQRLREKKYAVQVACDPDQRHWWLHAGESTVATPQTVAELIGLVDRAGVFVGNDSGPGHLAALAGVPTFTFFGPQLPEWFAPMPATSENVEGKACPYKPCSDYCRFPVPLCLDGVTEEEVQPRVESFIARHIA